ncbi:RES family NAD+ phosphorylase [Paracoccus sp. ME4]|uniref:RES family NAD+ phosphorylase n=1 Tax=Paracoccus sp. ME4 TaxID=3138066 RepID=UPI00398A58A2
MPSTIAIDLPDPDPDHFRAPMEMTVLAGLELHRIHHQNYGPCQFNGTHHGNARFSPIRDAGGQIIPTIYAAQSFRCACSEIILRAPDAMLDPGALTIVPPSAYQSYLHSTIRNLRDMRLVDLTAVGQRAVGLTGNALLTGGTLHYPATRAWAEAIHANVPWAEGIYYTSYQCGPDFAMVLFGDRLQAALGMAASPRPVHAPAVEDEIRTFGQMIGIEYVDL